jgi:hypothetical protein
MYELRRSCRTNKVKTNIEIIRFRARNKITRIRNITEKTPLWLKVITENLFICSHTQTIQLASGVIIKIKKYEINPAVGDKIAAMKPRIVIGAITGATRIFAGIVAREN